MKPEEMVGRRITEIRERSGMTQQQLGEHLGALLGKPWPRQTVSAAEKGNRAFTAAELIAIAHVLEVSIERLLVPPLDVDQIEMPSGAMLDREQIHRAAMDPTARNVLPLVIRAVKRIANRLNERVSTDSNELRELATLYEQLTGGKVPTDAVQARVKELVWDAKDQPPSRWRSEETPQ